MNLAETMMAQESQDPDADASQSNLSFLMDLPNYECVVMSPSFRPPYHHQLGMRLVPEVMDIIVREYIADFWEADEGLFEERKGKDDDWKTGSRERKEWVLLVLPES